MTIAFVLIRAIHFASCLLILATWAFDRIIAAQIAGVTGSAMATHWKRIVRRLSCFLLPGALVSGALWFVWAAANMSGQSPAQAIKLHVLTLVWSQTTFGAVCRWRLACWGVTALLTGLICFGRHSARVHGALTWCTLAASGALAGGLVWAGHGLAGSSGHRAADLMHLLAAGCWPGGLVPYFWLLWAAQSMAARDRSRFRWLLTCRFSTMSAIVVAVLTATGLINAWFLVGSVSGLSTTSYGRWLIAKVLLFVIMVGIGAMNLMRWRPRLLDMTDEDQNASNWAGRWILFNVVVELLLASAILLIVGILGILPHPVE